MEELPWKSSMSFIAAGDLLLFMGYCLHIIISFAWNYYKMAERPSFNVLKRRSWENSTISPTRGMHKYEWNSKWEGKVHNVATYNRSSSSYFKAELLIKQKKIYCACKLPYICLKIIYGVRLPLRLNVIAGCFLDKRKNKFSSSKYQRARS